MEEMRMNGSNAFIYCRVLSEKNRNLLLYQEEVLSKKAKEDGYEIFAKAHVVGSGRNFEYFEIQTLIGFIRKEKIDAIYIYDRTKLCVYEELYMEFRMLCDMHHIDIVCLNS